MKLLPFACLLLVLTTATSNADVVLYDSAEGTTPDAQGWFAVIPSMSSETISGGLLELDTSGNQADAAGYFSELPANGALEHPDMPVLDAGVGYTIRFDLQVVSETHITRDDNGDGLDDRAGFSLIAISENLQGLELAFFEDRVWSFADASEGANSLFTQAEGVDFDTTAALTTYDLVVSSTGYELFASGNSILSGNLRNYNPSGVNATINPYDNPSFLFFGDDTSSASSHTRIGTVQIIDAVPEPNSAIALLSALCVTALTRRKRKHGARFSLPSIS